MSRSLPPSNTLAGQPRGALPVARELTGPWRDWPCTKAPPLLKTSLLYLVILRTLFRWPGVGFLPAQL